MSHRSYPHPFLRYLKARLFIFRQPAFWGMSMFLFLIGIMSWEYWLKPDNLSEQQNSQVISEQPVPESDTTMSAEDQSIAADIDNLPVLLSDFDRAALDANLVSLPLSIQPQKNKNFLEDVIKQNNADEQSKNISNIANNLTPPIEKNPFVTQSENLLQFRNNNLDHQFLGTNSLTKARETTVSTHSSWNDQTLSPVLSNPLETAIKQSNNYNNGVSTSISINNSLPSEVVIPSNSVGYVQPTIANQQPNLYPNINSLQTSQTSVSPVNSAIPNNPYPVQSTNSVVVNPSTPVGFSNYNGYAIQQPTQSIPSNLAYPGQVQGQYPSSYRN